MTLIPQLKLRRIPVQWIISLVLIIDAPLAAVPQIWQMCQTQSSHDVSVWTWFFMFIVSVLWMWVAKRDNSPLMYWASLLWAAGDLAILLVALFFRYCV